MRNIFDLEPSTVIIPDDPYIGAYSVSPLRAMELVMFLNAPMYGA